MRPLTARTPKPLLAAGGKALIEYHIEALAKAGITNIVINTGRLGEQFTAALGAGERYGVTLRYSHEGDSPLETGGGIYNALPLLESQQFIAVNGDIWTDYDYSLLNPDSDKLCHLVLVNNPPHNPEGDFAFSDKHISNEGPRRYTFSGIAVYHRGLFKDVTDRVFSLAPLLRNAVENKLASAELYRGQWYDIGTPQRLAELDRQLQEARS